MTDDKKQLEALGRVWAKSRRPKDKVLGRRIKKDIKIGGFAKEGKK